MTTTRYEIRDAHNRCELSTKDYEVAKNYYDSFQRNMSLVKVTYSGPKPIVGSRSATRTTMLSRGV